MGFDGIHDELGRLNVILVDFDGTMMPFSWPSRHIPDPYPWVKPSLETLRRAGYKIVVFTSRAWEGWAGIIGQKAFEEQYDRMVEWLERHEIPYHSITAEKIPSLRMIDDRAISFDDDPGCEERAWRKLVDEACGPKQGYGNITWKREEI